MNRMLPRLGLLVAVAITTGAPLCAHAQANDKIAAEDLFQRGKAAMVQKNYADACPLLAESYRIDRAGGTLQNLAVCYEGLGKVASAYASFLELKTLAKQAVPPRSATIELADSHITGLEPRLSRVTIEMPAQNRVAGLTVTIDDVKYESAAWTAGILLDPGPHQLLVNAPERKPFSTTLDVNHDHTQLRAKVSVLQIIERPRSADPGLETKERSAHTLRTGGLVTGAAGLAVLGAGAVFGILSFTTDASAEKICAGGAVCEAYEAANSKRNDARAFANVANVLVPIGAVATAVGGILFWQGSKRAPKKSTGGLHFAPSFGGGSISGSF